jgi:hypothetical protein
VLITSTAGTSAMSRAKSSSTFPLLNIQMLC